MHFLLLVFQERYISMCLSEGQQKLEV